MPSAPAPTAATTPGKLLLAVLVVVVATALVYSAVPQLKFTSWDDPQNVFGNPYLSPLNGENFARIWSQGFLGLYAPVTYTFYALQTPLAESLAEQQIGAAPLRNPLVYHVSAVALHILSTVFVLLLLERLFHNPWGAACGALLFALHPLQVESVAWVSETKGLLAGCFGTFALWQYLCFSDHFERGRSLTWLNYALATAAILLAMLSKPSAAAIPLVAAAIDVGWLRRSPLRVALALLPWLALALWVAWVNHSLQSASIAEHPVPLWARPLLALDALAFYLFKLILPLGFCADYSHSPQAVLKESFWWATGALPLGILFWLASLSQRRAWLTAAAVFVVALLPTLGLVSFDYQRISTVADRYAYLALLGPALALAWFLSQGGAGPLVRAVIVCGLLGLGLLGYRQSLVWYNDKTLFTHTAGVNPKSFVAQAKLGNGYYNQGQYDQAVQHFRKAVEIDPSDASVHFNLAQTLRELSEFAEAIPHYRLTIEAKPKFANAYALLGDCYLRLQRFDEADFEYDRALRIDPNNALALQGKRALADVRAGLQQEQRRRQSAPASP
ncbi:MAG: tetratricopeptide repeat protein [Pirellulales bacterium]|nr:tetratricopeptide repeat protein [Pirellulales bacterium]